MVTFTRVLYCARKLPRKYLRKGMVDSLRLHVKAGPGGSGLPRYGGIGGSGGNVYVISEEGLTLETVKAKLKSKRLSAEAGSNSTNRGIIGTPGQDLVIKVPTGISVYNNNRVKLGEVNKDGDKLMVAKGGPGGSPESQYCGLKGQVETIVLDLKLIADIGLIGFPNAGKSTFLHAVSRAKPKIASYPFTTIRPQIGIINYQDYRQITVADLPGLIEGAHANIGMGHKFLKHVERTKMLLVIADIQGFQISPRHSYRSCLETIVLLNKEIELYKPDLLDRPTVVLINKMDTKNANTIYKETIEPNLKNYTEFLSKCNKEMQPEKPLRFDEILTASMKSNQQEEIDMIKEKIRNLIDNCAEAKEFTNDPEKELYEKLKRQTERYSPILV